MELMTAQSRARLPKQAILQEPRRPIAEMQTALGEARHMGEQAGHGVAHAARIHKAGTEHHVAAALAMHGPRRSEARKSRFELFGGAERPGMQLRIASRQPAGIAALLRRLIGKRRERHDLGALAPPPAQDMRIDE